MLSTRVKSAKSSRKTSGGGNRNAASSYANKYGNARRGPGIMYTAAEDEVEEDHHDSTPGTEHPENEDAALESGKKHDEVEPSFAVVMFDQCAEEIQAKLHTDLYQSILNKAIDLIAYERLVACKHVLYKHYEDMIASDESLKGMWPPSVARAAALEKDMKDLGGDNYVEDLSQVFDVHGTSDVLKNLLAHFDDLGEREDEVVKTNGLLAHGFVLYYLPVFYGKSPQERLMERFVLKNKHGVNFYNVANSRDIFKAIKEKLDSIEEGKAQEIIIEEARIALHWLVALDNEVHAWAEQASQDEELSQKALEKFTESRAKTQANCGCCIVQ